MCSVITQFRNTTIKVVTLIVLLGILSSCAKVKSDTTQGPTLTPRISDIESPTPKGDGLETPIIETSNPTSIMDPETLNFQNKVDVLFEVKENTKPAPVEVMKQLKYTAGFGGGGNYCENQEYWPEKMLFWSWGGPLDKVNNYSEDENITIEWHKSIVFSLCGLMPEVPVIYRILAPDGSIYIEKQITPRPNGSNDFASIYESLTFPINTDPGRYILSVTDNTETVSAKIDLITPEVPRVYRVGESYADLLYYLYNFQPNEKVTLLIYTDLDSRVYQDQLKTLFSWTEFVTTDDGQMVLKLEYPELSYWSLILIGEKSGEVHEYPGNYIAFDDHNVQIPEYELDITIPTQAEAENLRKILGSGAYKDPKIPTVTNYHISVSQNERVKWFYSWCAKNYENLSHNLQNITFEFFIQNSQLDNGYLTEFGTSGSWDWPCKEYTTYVGGWEQGRDYTLEVRYTIAQDISDGDNTYKAGVYRHLINVSVNE